jgi:hypothetical protein
MRAAILNKPRSLTAGERRDLVIAEPTDAVVRAVVACVNGSDRWYDRGDPPFEPGSIGHEFTAGSSTRSVSFMSMGNATLQLGADPAMRGRVMSLWFVAFQGSTPIGGPAVGVVMSAFGPRAGLGLGAVTCFAVAAAGALAVQVVGQRRASGVPARRVETAKR